MPFLPFATRGPLSVLLSKTIHQFHLSYRNCILSKNLLCFPHYKLPTSNFILNLRGKKKNNKNTNQISSISHKTKQQYQRNYNTLLLDFINFSVVYFCSCQENFFLKDVYFYCVFMLVGAGLSFPTSSSI